MKYITDVKEEHDRLEELQWAEIMSSGNAPAGMAVVFIQKLCTAFHELGPAFEKGALKPEELDFFKKRMASRIKKVISCLVSNKLENTDGFLGLNGILKKAENASSLKALAALTEEVHMTNHRLCDSLLAACRK